MKRFLTIFGAFLATLVAISYFFTNKLMYIKKKKDEDLLQRESQQHFDLQTFAALEKEEIIIPSPLGYDIHGYYMPVKQSNRFVIFCHGVTVSKITSIKYSNLFLKRGFHVIVYDHRRHGKTGGKTTSYGYYEKQDLKAVVDWVKQRFGENITLGIHGESMGAATLLQYAGMIEDGADFYIADCPYSDFYEQVSHRLDVEFKLPKWPFLPLANKLLKLRDGYTIRDISPIQYIENIHNPILFIHSKNDDYILAYMTEELYAKKQGPKQLFIAENGLHADSYGQNKQQYEEALDLFLQTYIL